MAFAPPSDNAVKHSAFGKSGAHSAFSPNVLHEKVACRKKELRRRFLSLIGPCGLPWIDVLLLETCVVTAATAAEALPRPVTVSDAIGDSAGSALSVVRKQRVGSATPLHSSSSLSCLEALVDQLQTVHDICAETMHAAVQREATLLVLRSEMDSASHASAHDSNSEESDDPGPAPATPAILRRIVNCIRELDRRTDDVVALILLWRTMLRRPLPFMVDGTNYLLKIRADIDGIVSRAHLFILERSPARGSLATLKERHPEYFYVSHYLESGLSIVGESNGGGDRGGGTGAHPCPRTAAKLNEMRKAHAAAAVRVRATEKVDSSTSTFSPSPSQSAVFSSSSAFPAAAAAAAATTITTTTVLPPAAKQSRHTLTVAAVMAEQATQEHFVDEMLLRCHQRMYPVLLSNTFASLRRDRVTKSFLPAFDDLLLPMPLTPSSSTGGEGLVGRLLPAVPKSLDLSATDPGTSGAFLRPRIGPSAARSRLIFPIPLNLDVPASIYPPSLLAKLAPEPRAPRKYIRATVVDSEGMLTEAGLHYLFSVEEKLSLAKGKTASQMLEYSFAWMHSCYAHAKRLLSEPATLAILVHTTRGRCALLDGDGALRDSGVSLSAAASAEGATAAAAAAASSAMDDERLDVLVDLQLGHSRDLQTSPRPRSFSSSIRSLRSQQDRRQAEAKRVTAREANARRLLRATVRHAANAALQKLMRFHYMRFQRREAASHLARTSEAITLLRHWFKLHDFAERRRAAAWAVPALLSRTQVRHTCLAYRRWKTAFLFARVSRTLNRQMFANAFHRLLRPVAVKRIRAYAALPKIDAAATVLQSAIRQTQARDDVRGRQVWRGVHHHPRKERDVAGATSPVIAKCEPPHGEGLHLPGLFAVLQLTSNRTSTANLRKLFNAFALPFAPRTV